MQENREMAADKKAVTGTVVSDSMKKSAVVRLDSVTRHPLYKKVIRRSRKVMAHDEKGEAKTGDIVKISVTRPVSKKKRWKIVKIIKSAERY